MYHFGGNITFAYRNPYPRDQYVANASLFCAFRPTYGSFKNLLIKKTNKLLIPFLFFFIVTYAILYLIRFVFPVLAVTQSSNIWDLFFSNPIFNVPLWFLLSLFWVNIISYFINSVKAEWARFILVICCAFTGYCTLKFDIQLPLFMNAAFIYMPFFYMGAMMKKTTVLVKNKSDKYIPLFIILLYTIVYFSPLPTIFGLGSATQAFERPEDNFGLNLLLFYPTALCMVLALLLLCKMIKQLPLISYVGRYSIIILCTHFLVLIAIDRLSDYFDISITFISIMAVSTAMIPICRKLIPWFTAQKDLIPIRQTDKSSCRTDADKV